MSKSKRQIEHLQRKLDRSEIYSTEKSLELLNKEQEYEELLNTLKECKEENKNLQLEVNRWKSLSERLPDDAELEELRRTNRKQSKLINNLEKEITKLTNTKEMLSFQIKTIEESKNDLKAQLSELRSDFKRLKD
jgi:chromosome segregation ATPase